MSTAQACTNAETEIPDFDFDQVANSSRSQHDTYLNRIRVDHTGVSETYIKLFYSSVFREGGVDIVISYLDISTELYGGKSTLGYGGTYV
jgi:hypothetical protein